MVEVGEMITTGSQRPAAETRRPDLVLLRPAGKLPQVADLELWPEVGDGVTG